MTLVLKCEQHGTVYELPGAKWTDPADYSKVVPVLEVPPPKMTDPVECPLCHGALTLDDPS